MLKNCKLVALVGFCIMQLGSCGVAKTERIAEALTNDSASKEGADRIFDPQLIENQQGKKELIEKQESNSAPDKTVGPDPDSKFLEVLRDSDIYGNKKYMSTLFLFIQRNIGKDKEKTHWIVLADYLGSIDRYYPIDVAEFEHINQNSKREGEFFDFSTVYQGTYSTYVFKYENHKFTITWSWAYDIEDSTWKDADEDQKKELLKASSGEEEYVSDTVDSRYLLIDAEPLLRYLK